MTNQRKPPKSAKSKLLLTAAFALPFLLQMANTSWSFSISRDSTTNRTCITATQHGGHHTLAMEACVSLPN